MDLARLDHLARSLAATGSRRHLLGVLGALPMLGDLLDALDPQDADAKERRRRRKQRHRRRKDHGTRKKGCTPKSKAVVCAGTCGPIKNRETCGKAMDCGSCACNPPCGECLTCQEGSNTSGTCVADPARLGQPCGAAGQVCQADGTCACQAGSCPGCDTCLGDGSCQPCTGCCDGDTCLPGNTMEACGAGGAACDVCAEGSELCTSTGVCAGCGEPGGPCRVFLTSTFPTGSSLGGLAGADAICQTLAEAAELPGTYMAWLSDGEGEDDNWPAKRFPTKASGPYRLVTGETVADSWEDLTTNLPLKHAINVHENGETSMAFWHAWTDTMPDGTAEPGGVHCGKWSVPNATGDMGSYQTTEAAWTGIVGANSMGCTNPLALYCFQQS